MLNSTLLRVRRLRPLRLLLLAWAWLAASAAYAQTGSTDLTAAWLGTIDQANLTVTGLPANAYVAQLLSGSRAVGGATVQVVSSSGVVVARNTVLTAGLSLRVTDTGGLQKSYTIQPTGAPLQVESFNNAASTTQAAITNRILSVSGSSEFHVTGTNPLPGTMIDMQGTDVWLYFEGIKPSKFQAKVLPQVTINGQRARVDTTVRLVQYLQGCVLISQPSTYQPLQAYTGANLTGSAMLFSQYTYYKSADLGAFNDAIVSFKLKEGYMATFATDETGTGTSKVYIAANNDLLVNLPANLSGKASLVRVFPWRWVTKKGWSGGTVGQGDSLRVQWSYDWGNNRRPTLDQEYVPMRWNGGSPAIATTNAKKNVTHLLGFNEPDSPKQSNMSPQAALLNWPALLQSGLRVGSPAPTDGGASWLYKFIDKADSAGYRVDYVALHFYRGCQTAQQFYNYLKSVYDRTKRPIWITEWNNGANWTSSTNCPKPSYADEAAKIQSFITMLDTARIVERYSIYQWVEDTRKMYVTDSDLTSLTPAGIVYRGKISPMAYNPNLVPPVASVPVLVPVPFNQGNLVLTRYGNAAWAGTAGNTLPVYVDEYVPVSGSLYNAGQLIRSIAIPTTSYGANFAYVGSAVRTNADGAIGISPDRTKMAISGFNLGTNSSDANGGSAARVVAILDADGNLDTRTGFSDGGGKPMRTATVTDSATVYIAYGASTLGLKHASLPAAVTTTPQTRTGITIFPTISLKKMAVYENDLYFTQTNSGSAKLMKLSGLPGRAATPTALPGIPTVSTVQPSGFVMFDVNPNVPGFDLLYYTDDNSTAASPSTLNKYTFDGTIWTLSGTYTIPTTAVAAATGGTTIVADKLLRDLTGTLVKGIPTLYAVSYSSLIKLEDKAVKYTLSTPSSSYAAAPSITITSLLNAQAANANNYSYRGVAFAPGTRDSLYVRVPQTITFTAIPDQVQGALPFTANATTTSGLEMGYTTSDPTVATINNSLITIVGPGTVTITASQSGNFKYLGAMSVARTFTVLGDLTVVAGQTMAMPTASSYGNVLVQGSLTLNAPLTVAGTVTVASGGMLTTNCQPLTGAASFTVAAGAELRVCDAAGLSPTGAMTGAVQTTGIRLFSSDATYTYNGTAAQITGLGLPGEVRSLGVSNPQGVSLSAPLNVNQVVRLSQGNLTLGSQGLTLLSNTSGTALVDNTGGVVVGAATMQRYIDPTPNPATGTGPNPMGLGYRHYSSPVRSATVADLATANFTPLAASSGAFPNVYGYDQSLVTASANNFNAGWVAPATLASPLVVGQGYTVNLPATALVDFVGTLNNGPLNLTLNCGAPSEAGWNFLGNPYPSPLDWNTVTVPAGVGGAVYLNTSTGQYSGSYRSFVNNVGVSELIPAGQGFFLRATTAGTSPVLALTNANRVTTFGAQTAFQRRAETRSLVQLHLGGAAGTGTDDAYVYFESGATAGFDGGFDAGKLPNSGTTAVNLYSVAGAEPLSINGLPQLGTQSLVVPLGLAVAQPGTYALTAAQLLNQTGSVALRDKLTGTLTPLAAGTSYSFTVVAGAPATGRFELLFGPQSPLSTAPAALSQQVALYPNPTQGDVQISLPASLQAQALQATVYNALGQLVLRHSLPAGAALRPLPLAGLVPGVYVVQLETSAGIVTKRLVFN